MAISVSDNTKVIIAKYGPNKLFGDWDERKKLSNEQLIALFDTAWQAELKHAVTAAIPCDAKSAYEKLAEKYRAYFDFEQEHRELRVLDMWMIAQFTPLPDSNQELTQLWYIRSSDIDPKVLYIRFDTVEERKRFRNLASFLGQNDERLGKKLILEFMEKFPDTLTSDIESFKRQLTQRQKNLNYLEERAAKYAGNVPVELHNQIEDEKEAISILKNRIDTWNEG